MQHTSLDWSGVVHYLVGLESSGRPSGDEADNMSIEYLCKKTIAEGYQGRVSVGHLTALHALPKEELDQWQKQKLM